MEAQHGGEEPHVEAMETNPGAVKARPGTLKAQPCARETRHRAKKANLEMWRLTL
jgi:hypothetical protein